MIRIVCAYSDLMNLYGEYAAPLLLKARLQQADAEVEIVRFSVGDPLFLSRCDLLLFSAGTERSMLRALVDLRARREELRTSRDLLRVRRHSYLGDQLPVTLWRDGALLEVTLDLREGA